jgi:hypothetical protein
MRSNNYARRARLRAALRAAMARPRRPFVLAACRAEADRAALGRCRAAERACLESAFLDAALRPSRLSARSVARDRRGAVSLLPRRPLA